MPSEGKLIVLECVDEATIEAQVRRLYRWLRELGVTVEQTGEPTYGPVGAQIRLSQQGRLQIDPASLALFWTADRMDHLGHEDGILSWLADGRHVLCARYLLFSYAHQLDHVGLNWLRQINARCRRPDLTLFLDVGLVKRTRSPRTCSLGRTLSAASNPAERTRSPSTPDLGWLRQNYLAIIDTLRSEGAKIVIVDAGTCADEALTATIGRTLSAFAACQRQVADLLGL